MNPKDLDSVDRLCWFIRERESIRLKRAAGEPRPWTRDPILQSYRFCNVRRADDRVSQWLLHNWYEPFKNHANVLPAVALARFVNNPRALEFVGFPKRWDSEHVKRKLRQFRADGYNVFNAAYVIRGGKAGGEKIAEVVDAYCAPLRACRKFVDSDSMQRTHTNLLGCFGFGSFMAGQVVADLRWAVDGEWKDKLTWAPLGPGSKRGMNRLLDRPIDAPLNQDQFEEYLTWMIEELSVRLPASIVLRLEAMDYQNLCCEMDKYSRALFGEGRPKQLYNGG